MSKWFRSDSNRAWESLRVLRLIFVGGSFWFLRVFTGDVMQQEEENGILVEVKEFVVGKKIEFLVDASSLAQSIDVVYKDDCAK